MVVWNALLTLHSFYYLFTFSMVLSPFLSSWLCTIFDGSTQCRERIIGDAGSFQTFVCIVRDMADVDLTFHTLGEDAEIVCNVLIVWSSWSAPRCIVTWILEWVRSRITLRLMTLVCADAHPTVHGGITIVPWAFHVSWHLMEDNVLLHDRVKLSVLPKLDVHTHDVSASHWAKIHRLDPAKLFYLHAKWLSPYAAKKIMLTWHITDILSPLNNDSFIANTCAWVLSELLVS
jgi:hypothetical protein